MNVAKGLKNAAGVCKLRVTIGELAHGQSSCGGDEWETTAEPHELLGQPWQGTTYFTDSVETLGVCFVSTKIELTNLSCVDTFEGLCFFNDSDFLVLDCFF